jgi:hypothetical protein
MAVKYSRSFADNQNRGPGLFVGQEAQFPKVYTGQKTP